MHVLLLSSKTSLMAFLPSCFILKVYFIFSVKSSSDDYSALHRSGNGLFTWKN